MNPDNCKVCNGTAFPVTDLTRNRSSIFECGTLVMLGPEEDWSQSSKCKTLELKQLKSHSPTMNTIPPHDLKDSGPNGCSDTATDPTPPCGDPALYVGPGSPRLVTAEDQLTYAQELQRESRRMKEEAIRQDSIVMLNILQSLARIEARIDAINATKQTP